MKQILNKVSFKSNKNIYLSIFLLNILIVFSLLLLNYMSNRFYTHNKHLTNSIENIKYKITQSHLWTEEYLYGDKKEYNKINLYLDESIKSVDILLNGGMIKGFHYKNMHTDDSTAKFLLKAKKQLLELHSLVDVRLKKYTNDIMLDSIYDLKFEQLIITLQKLDDYVTEKFRKMFSIYMYIQYGVYFAILLLFSISIYLIYKLNREIDNNLLLSYVDSLTNVQNIKGYKEKILELISIYNRYKISFTIISFDIDNFKKINDTYGYRVGDLVLIDLTKLVNSNIRNKNDIQYRIGGEEFIILCQNTILSEGINVAEKIRKDIETNLNSIKDKVITISIGITEVKENDTEDIIYKRVDELLYKSKNSGKNIVTSDTDIT